MRGIGALKNLAQLDLHFLRAGSMLAPALPPGFEQQRLAGIGIMISRHNQRCTGLQTSMDGPQDFALGVIARQMVQHTDQGGRVV
ncbi:hypothetical protein D3C76_1038600 [compost metagenome]